MHGISDRVRRQCQLIAQHARLVTGSPRANLLLYDETRRTLVTVATTGADVPLQQIALDLIRRNHDGLDPLDLSYPPDANASVSAAFVGQRTQVNTMAEAFAGILPPSAVVLAHGLVGITHVVSCPVIADRRALGLIRFLVPAQPGDADLALMEAAASQIGLTLANAELAEETRRQLAATQAIAEVARLGATAGVSATLDALVTRVRELTEADAALVYLVDASGTTYSPAAESLSYPELAADVSRLESPARQVGAGLVGWVIAAGEAAFVPDVRLDPRAASLRTGRPPEATIIVPMRTPGGTIGCLRVTVLGSRRFAESDLWLAQTLADQVVLVVQIAQEQERVRGQAPSRARALAMAAAALHDITQPVDDFLSAALIANEHAADPQVLQAQLEAARAAAHRIEAGAASLRELVACGGDGAASGAPAMQSGSGSSTVAPE